MPKESIDEPLSTLEMGSQLPDIAGVRAHFTIKRKPGYPTSGMTYLGLHNSAPEAEEARQAESRRYRKHPTVKAEWLETTEVVKLLEGEEYSEHGLGTLIHGENDGAHGSRKATIAELRIAWRRQD